MFDWLVNLGGDLLSFVAGLLMGAAATLWWRHTVHDSVLRYGHLDSSRSHPDAMRTMFCAIVNGRKELLDRNGKEIHIVTSKMIFYGVVLGIIFMVAVFLGFLGFISEVVKSLNRKSALFFPTCQLGAALLVWIYCWVRLNYPKHQTLLITHRPPRTPPPKDAPPVPMTMKWVRLTAERGEDGLPTKNPEVKFGDGEPGLW